jgi:hypothetical protein
MPFTLTSILVAFALLAGATIGAVAKLEFGYAIESNGRQARSIQWEDLGALMRKRAPAEASA